MIAIIGWQIVEQEYLNNCRLNHWKPECDAKCKHYTINAQYTIGAKNFDAKKKVGRKQNIKTFFLLEIGQLFKQVWIGQGKGLSEIPTVKAYTKYFSNFNLAKKIVTFSKIYLLLFHNQKC